MSQATSAQLKRAIIYARVSSDRAGGRSVKEQEAECRAECARNGWPVAEVLIDNDRSASRYATKDRPEFARLRDLLSPGDVLVMWEASRATRDMARYVELRDLLTARGVLWSYSGKLFDLDDGGDRFSTGLDILMQEKAAEETRDRILRSHRANLAAGKPHGRVPYGYRIVRDPDTGRAVGRIPDPARAPLVAEAARRVLDGHSLESTVRWIASKDPDPRWNGAKLRRILLNATNAGYRTQSAIVGGKRTPQQIVREGTWEAILTPEQHDDLVALFAARKTGPRGTEPQHLLSGIAVCAVCEDKIWAGKAGRKKDGTPYEIYKCRKGCVGRNRAQVDGAVLSVIDGILSTPDSLAALAAPPAEPDSTVGADLAALRDRLAAVEDQITDGTMPAATGARVSARLTEQITALETAIKPVFTDPVVAEIANAPDPVALWKSLPLAQRRDFIRALMRIGVERVTSRWHAASDGISITPVVRAPNTLH